MSLSAAPCPTRYPKDVELLAWAERFAERCTRRTVLEGEADFPAREFAELTGAGLLAVPVRAAGGMGFAAHVDRILALLRLLKLVGRGNLALGRIYEGHINALQLIEQFATPHQRRRYTGEAAQGKLFGVWNTQAHDGVTLQAVGAGRYRLSGCKTFASGAGYVARAFVNGRLAGGGWQMCVVEMDQVNVRIDRDWWRPLGMQASASYKVDFSGVEVDSESLIGEPGDYLKEPWFSGGAIRFAAVQLGGAEALFAITRKHLRDSQRITDPYQRARLGEMVIAIESGNLWLEGAARAAANANRAAESLIHYSGMMRSAVEGLCLQVAERAQRSIGAAGFLQPHPMERVLRDLLTYLRQPAPDQALAEVGRRTLEDNDE